MNRLIVKHDLDLEETLYYFIEHLSSGKTLAEKVIKRVDFRKGSFFTLLPSNAVLEFLYRFPYGGIIPSIPYGDQIYYVNGKEFHPRQVITMNQECIEFIASYLRESLFNCAIIDDYLAKQDTYSKECKNSVFYGEKEVYSFLDRNNSIEEILSSIRTLTRSWYFLGLLTSLPFETQKNISEEVLDIMCDNAKFVLAGAYDGEGFIFWQRNE